MNNDADYEQIKRYVASHSYSPAWQIFVESLTELIVQAINRGDDTRAQFLIKQVQEIPGRLKDHVQ